MAKKHFLKKSASATDVAKKNTLKKEVEVQQMWQIIIIFYFIEIN